ncbi:MAG: adenosylmethionine--8-amino-7-oxononanoate transaminase [Gammaproteobacteria bacterium]|nr:adenosylmethionine--8-amino-7-oxononanoate transaminase [Gammaproteobacteria bacterium]
MSPLLFDAQHLWHPYSAIGAGHPVYQVVAARGVRLQLADGRELIDGISSWWCAIHGYNHPQLNQAINAQLAAMAHVMFGGLTHPPAVALAELLLKITPAKLQTVFFADSGSISVEVALKMALQYWQARGAGQKRRFVALRRGYHGDTFGAMSVSDPDTGLHTLFQQTLAQQLFIPAPTTPYGEPCADADIAPLRDLLAAQHQEIAAVILEPVVQGAGGMRFYAADYLRHARKLCDTYGVLLIFDEIATGFGRTGTLFAAEQAAVCPDMMTIGKALSGGYMTLAATLTTEEVSSTISRGTPGIFMHGPTFMANPLACAVALASCQLLLSSPWQARVAALSVWLERGLAPCRQLPQVAKVRVLGAIGVVELKAAQDLRILQPLLVDAGVWVRPFGKLVYLMPPYIMAEADCDLLTAAVCRVVAALPEAAT